VKTAKVSGSLYVLTHAHVNVVELWAYARFTVSIKSFTAFFSAVANNMRHHNAG
jgi:hypothetical protein